MRNEPRPSVTYAHSGVSFDAAEETIRRFRAAVEATHGPEVLGGIGHFGGLFRPDLTGMADPVLVSGADGVGTKLRIAFATGIHDTVGIDLVAMSVNDILMLGARPLFFLDYLAVARVTPERDSRIVAGVAEGCRRAECALIGGELAELGDLYHEDEYDLAGFAVGVVDRARIVDGSKTAVGDVLVGAESSGLHSNGYSLARRAVLGHAGLRLDDELPGCGRSVAEEMLEPTTIYTRHIRTLLQQVDVRGLANITGGGIVDNVARAIPDGLCAEVQVGSWPVHPVFTFIQRSAKVEFEEMHRVFNMGVGFVATVPESGADRAIETCAELGTRAYRIGVVREATSPRKVELLR